LAHTLKDLVSRIRQKLRDWQLTKLRNAALKYINLLNRGMIVEGYSRQKRQQFFRELAKEGKFYQGEET
jgi:hypothetical protein